MTNHTQNLPWRLHFYSDPVEWEIRDSKENTVISEGTFTGDGDTQMNLSLQDAERLVELVNLSME